MTILSKIIGQKLEMICVNSTQLYFHFSGNAYICIYDKYDVNIAGRRDSSVVPNILSGLSLLLESNVSVAEISEEGIRMEFGDLQFISVPASDRYVEYFRYVINGNEIKATD